MIISDVMSVFDVSSCGVIELRFVLWVGNFLFIMFFLGVLFVS